ncbi:unnamed protein product [Heligmosomoides polygyrus]|uniref:DSPn domain-containing protein n=1 Tax=Heligmosomoides polygyrus TaxID=6339 RepID=A0A183F2S0_HELPZ|nr:unnamed protein product [Heligmosomoides polygyrus]
MNMCFFKKTARDYSARSVNTEEMQSGRTIIHYLPLSGRAFSNCDLPGIALHYRRLNDDSKLMCCSGSAFYTTDRIHDLPTGYALLMLYRACGDEEWLQRARCFALMILDKKIRSAQRTPDSPFSLFEGLSGALCFLVDLMSDNLEKAQFPLYPVPF